jgi:hypothetical protein
MGAAMLLSPAKMIHLYVFPLPLGLVAIIFVIFETLVAQFQPADFTGIATIAHLAGIAFGALFALFTEPKKAGKGLLALALIFLLLIFLGPVFSIIASIGSAVLQIIEAVVGSVLYGIARLLSFLWV